MKLQLDKSVDALYIELLEDVQVAETYEINDDIYIDVDEAGNVIGIEVLNFSDYQQLDIPSLVMPAHLNDVKSLSTQLVA